MRISSPKKGHTSPGACSRSNQEAGPGRSSPSAAHRGSRPLTHARFASCFSRFMRYAEPATVDTAKYLARLINNQHGSAFGATREPAIALAAAGSEPATEFAAELVSQRKQLIALLDIGAGPGDLSLTHLLPRLSMNVSYSAYEPNPELADRLEARLWQAAGGGGTSNAADEVTGRLLDAGGGFEAGHGQCNCKPGLVLREAFSPSTRLLPVWDVILLCHSLYGCHPHVDHVRAARVGLAPGGILILVHRAGPSTTRLQAELSSDLPDGSPPSGFTVGPDEPQLSGHLLDFPPASFTVDPMCCLESQMMADRLMCSDAQLDDVLSVIHGEDLGLAEEEERAIQRFKFRSVCTRSASGKGLGLAEEPPAGGEGCDWTYPLSTDVLVVRRPPDAYACSDASTVGGASRELPDRLAKVGA